MRLFPFLFALFLPIEKAFSGILGAHRCGTSVIAVLDSASAAPLMATGDSYTRALTSFDLQSKVGTDGDLTERGYLRKAASQARTWSMVEQKVLQREIGLLHAAIQSLKLQPKMPDTVWLIKSTCREEYGADGYTRRNMIMLSAARINHRLLAHELFHVISRRDTVRRDAAYAVIGFRKCAPVNVSAALQSRSITNPDCPVIQHYITLKDGEGRLRDFVLIIYSNRDYTGGDVFGKYLTVGFLEVAGRGTDKRPLMVDGKPVLVEVYAMPDLFKKVGENTSYLLHPEEISAEHFAMLITKEPARTKQLITGLQKVLQ